jgi:hypothetical protein
LVVSLAFLAHAGEHPIELKIQPASHDPYSRPLLVYKLRQTIRRILSSPTADATEDATLTARGRRNRLRRQREGLLSSRIDDAADEEERVGMSTVV